MRTESRLLNYSALIRCLLQAFECLRNPHQPRRQPFDDSGPMQTKIMEIEFKQYHPMRRSSEVSTAYLSTRNLQD
jgi:inhibitor of KinA sporulation pathway (predicted exonuclease)